MNVMVYNKYKEILMGLNIEIMKSLEGVYNVDEIIDTFTNFYYDKMILDITAIRDYQNTDNLQKLAMNINMENVILLLDNTPETTNKSYLSKLISLGIYNFTKNADGINYLLVHPHTYRDVVNLNNIEEFSASGMSQTQIPTASVSSIPTMPSIPETPVIPASTPMPSFIQPEYNPMATPSNSGGRMKVIGFKNVTQHAGATSLIYMLKKQLTGARNIVAFEVNKVDFMYFNEPDMISTTTADLLKEVMRHQNCDLILIDLNDYPDTDVCTSVYNLIEPSTLMINKMMRKNRNILESLKGENIILNKCVLNSEDVATFEYETKLKVLAAIPPVDDRQTIIAPIKNFANKINL